MIDPPPPLAKPHAVFAIDSGFGMVSLNSRVLLSGKDMRSITDID
ncbi:MAG: hypothetical protein Q8M95_04190 [Candidatus Methanoperedens sp.]|nr:hypothetical protein [Candidatus Methanoperedens sp.]